MTEHDDNQEQWPEEVAEAEEFLSGMIRQIDSSLIDEWEKLREMENS